MPTRCHVLSTFSSLPLACNFGERTLGPEWIIGEWQRPMLEGRPAVERYQGE